MTRPSLYDYLKKNQMFAGLNSYAFHIIESYLSFQELQVGQVLFNEGDRGDYMAFVVVGQMEILKKREGNSMIRLATLQAGDSIGEMAIIDELSRSATVKALKRSGLVILPKEDFDRILQDHPRIGIDMLKGIAVMLSLKLRETSQNLSQRNEDN